MSGAVEGVALRKIIRDMLDGKAGARDAARQVLTTTPARSYADGVSGEALFRAFMASDVTRLTTTALPEEWPRMQPSYQQAWEDFAIRLLSQGGKA